MDEKNKDIITAPITLCVGAVVLRENKVLFVRQSYGSLKEKWSLPWGFVDGKKSDGTLETPDMAAIRETKEEAGVVAEVEGLLGIQNHSINGEPQLYVIFLCRHIDGEPKPDNYETDKAAYFSLDDMACFSEPLDEFCKWMADRVLRGQYYMIPRQPINPYYPYLAFF